MSPLFFKKKATDSASKSALNRRESANPFEDFVAIAKEKVAEERPVFVTGVGRSGTHFLASLFGSMPQIDGYHLDEVGNSTADSYLMYCKWYRLPVDLGGFFASRNYLISKAKAGRAVYLESNPYLALSIRDLKDYYPRARFVIPFRDPRKVVLSHYNKGWYADYQPVLSSTGQAPFYQYQVHKPNHFFGRIFPFDQVRFDEWTALTQVGKIAWMWTTICNEVINQLSGASPDGLHLMNIGNFDFESYLELCGSLDLSNALTKEEFDQLLAARPGKTKKKTFAGWGELEEQEFREQVGLLHSEVKTLLNIEL